MNLNPFCTCHQYLLDALTSMDCSSLPFPCLFLILLQIVPQQMGHMLIFHCLVLQILIVSLTVHFQICLGDKVVFSVLTDSCGSVQSGYVPVILSFVVEIINTPLTPVCAQ